MTEKVYSAPVLESLSLKATSDLIHIHIGLDPIVDGDVHVLPGLGS